MSNFRKSQLTIFMILGITLILLVAISSFLINSNVDVKNKQIEFRDLDDIDDPVEKYIVDCLKFVSKDSIKQMGEHGGITSIRRHGLDVNIAKPTESDAVTLPIGGTLNPNQEPFAIPYYYYMSSPDGCSKDCKFRFQIPQLKKEEGSVSIESEMEYFVEENIEQCLNNFEDLKRQGYSFTNVSDFSVEANINYKDISFILRYPIKFTKEGKDYTLNEFYYKHNIEFAPTYELAVVLSALQMRYKYLEGQAMNLVGGFSGLGRKLPPLGDSTFDFGSEGQMWIKSNVAREMSEILLKYVQALRVKGTNNYVEIGNKEGFNNLLNTQLQIAIPEEFSEVGLQTKYDREVYFSYLPNWPMYFDLSCDGELCKPESFSFSLLSLTIGNQRYKFLYSMSYPVMVKIYDPNAFDGEGFSYYFALESNLRYNSPIREGLSIGEEVPQIEDSLLCNLNQRNSGEYNFTTIDELTLKPVSNVVAHFTCGSTSCNVASSKSGEFREKLPLCTQGVLTFESNGYVSRSIIVQSYLDRGEDLGNIILRPIRKKNFTINKLKFAGTGSNWAEHGFSRLGKNEEAIIFLTKKKEDFAEPDFSQVILLNSTHTQEEIEIVPGEYEVEVTMLDRNKIIIPKKKKKDYTLPSIEFNESTPWLLGGLEGDFVVRSIVDDFDTLVLNVVAFELKDVPEASRSISSLNILSKRQTYINNSIEKLGFRYEGLIP